jgi:putative spermidine/putrescine transport system permease protein
MKIVTWYVSGTSSSPPDDFISLSASAAGVSPEKTTLMQRLTPYLQVSPLTLVFLLFFIVPLMLTVVVSFWDYNEYELLPDFTTRNYKEIFEGCLADLPQLCLTFKTYLSTLKFCFLVWLFTLVIGFTVAYFLSINFSTQTVHKVRFLIFTNTLWT